MSQQVFAQSIDMSPASLSNIFNERTKPTLNIVEAIKHKFPTISTDWLMFGNGDMYESTPHAEGDTGSMKIPSASSDTGNIQEPTLDFGFADSIAPTPRVHAVPTGGRVETAAPSPVSHRQEKAAEETVRYIERPPRRVTEIRVYYDDQTYESFVPAHT